MSPITGRLRRLLGGELRDGAGPVQAVWHGVVLAESERTVMVEGNHYFPPEDIEGQHLEPSPRHTVCLWKGTASYYDVVVEGERNRDAAWSYRSPSRAAARIKGRVAFGDGVSVTRAPAAA